MSISCIFGSPIVVLPKPKPASQFHSVNNGGSGGGLVIECSSRPKKKATAHHRKTRPKKSQPWDIKRKPTVYAPLPVLPPDWTLVSSSDDDDEIDASASSQAPDLQAPIATA